MTEPRCVEIIENTVIEVETDASTGTIVINTRGGELGQVSLQAKEFIKVMEIFLGFLNENMGDPTGKEEPWS